jgi:hypothetical protein
MRKGSIFELSIFDLDLDLDHSGLSRGHRARGQPLAAMQVR